MCNVILALLLIFMIMGPKTQDHEPPQVVPTCDEAFEIDQQLPCWYQHDGRWVYLERE
jgi:hypothetical protein